MQIPRLKNLRINICTWEKSLSFNCFTVVYKTFDSNKRSDFQFKTKWKGMKVGQRRP